MGRVADVVAGLLLGAGCAGCAGSGVPLCGDCAAALRSAPFATEPDPVPTGFPPTWTTTPYAGVVRRMLLAHKEEGRLALARPLGLALARAVAAALQAAHGDRGAGAGAGTDRRVWLVPVPSSRPVVRARGHDALLRTARAAAVALRGDGVPAGVLPLLRQRRRVADSARLTSEQRRANLADSLWVPPRLRPLSGGGRLVVVDDVVTTGATLSEAARALAAAGGRDVRAATVAATQRRAGPRAEPREARPPPRPVARRPSRVPRPVPGSSPAVSRPGARPPPVPAVLRPSRPSAARALAGRVPPGSCRWSGEPAGRPGERVVRVPEPGRTRVSSRTAKH